jgi:NTE family protein
MPRSSIPGSRALVLGGGGIAAIALHTGLLAGLARHGVDVLAADLVVGTSAGATVAAQITGGTPLEDLLAAQIDGTAGDEPPSAVDLRVWFATWQEIEREAPDGRTAVSASAASH